MAQDILIGRPTGFSVVGKHFFLYPASLGKTLLCSRLIASLEIDMQAMLGNMHLEALRIAKKQRATCIELIAYATLQTKSEVFNYELVERRKKFFDKELDWDDVASMLLIILSSDKTEQLMQYYGIDKERERLNKVIRWKERQSKGSVTFGGKSVYGILLDTACERYGWTYDYILWEIPYTVLQLMLADKTSDIFLSEDERKKIPASYLVGSDDIIRGDDPKNKELIHQMDWH